MSHSSCSRAILVTDLLRGATLLPALLRRYPDRHWQIYADLAQAVFELCGGGYELALVDGDHVGGGVEALLRSVRRCVPGTRLLIFARAPHSPEHAAVAACGWLDLVATDTLTISLGNAR